MAHHQRAVRTAVLLNASIFGVELIAGWQASSLSLIMDGIHNFSDQLAMVAIWLAFCAGRLTFRASELSSAFPSRRMPAERTRVLGVLFSCIVGRGEAVLRRARLRTNIPTPRLTA
jgi:Cation efflux family